MDIGTQVSGVRCQVSVVKKVRTGLKPDTRHLKPILQEAFTTPDKVQKKDLIFYHFTTSAFALGKPFQPFQARFGILVLGLYPFFKRIVGKTAKEGGGCLFDAKADAVRLGGKIEYQAGV